jgi:hypothetical protein
MAITTTYRGIEYRSRLEARWAAFFTRLGWTFTYEPFDGDGYIPDFILHGDNPVLVEIKPATIPAEYNAPIAKMVQGVAAHWNHDLLILGVTPLPFIGNLSWEQHPSLGLLGENIGPGWEFGGARWMTCGQCGLIGFFHEDMGFDGRTCGHYDGDALLGSVDQRSILATWADACNDVKWQGRAA